MRKRTGARRSRTARGSQGSEYSVWGVRAGSASLTRHEQEEEWRNNVRAGWVRTSLIILFALTTATVLLLQDDVSVRVSYEVVEGLPPRMPPSRSRHARGPWWPYHCKADDGICVS